MIKENETIEPIEPIELNEHQIVKWLYNNINDTFLYDEMTTLFLKEINYKNFRIDNEIVKFVAHSSTYETKIVYNGFFNKKEKTEFIFNDLTIFINKRYNLYFSFKTLSNAIKLKFNKIIDQTDEKAKKQLQDKMINKINLL